MSEPSGFRVYSVEDPEGKYWWECEECQEGGHSDFSSAPEFDEHRKTCCASPSSTVELLT